MDSDGKLQRFTTLHLLAPEGGITEQGEFFDDLPWWLQDARPQGFLGRLVPRRHPELPPDIRLWGADTVLDYLEAYGWDVPGDLIVGEPALTRWLSAVADVPDPAAAPEERYPKYARDVLAHGVIGSSAGGEQSKFLATRIDAGRPVGVLVKFSPPRTTPLAQRISDLLRAEHHAAQCLAAAGVPAAQSRLLEADDRCFLEVERFDRTDWPGRLGVVSLASVDAEFAGIHAGWTRTVEALVARKVLPASLLEEVQRREAFGHLIHNTDMHLGNLSFTWDGDRVTGLTPSYDMLPMRFAPRGHELPQVDPTPPPPRVTPGWVWAWEHACTFWRTVQSDAGISPAFRSLAGQCLAGLQAQQDVIARLPR